MNNFIIFSHPTNLAKSFTPSFCWSLLIPWADRWQFKWQTHLHPRCGTDGAWRKPLHTVPQPPSEALGGQNTKKKSEYIPLLTWFYSPVVQDFFHQHEHLMIFLRFLREFLNFVNWAMFLDNMSKPHLGYLGGRCFYQLTVMTWNKKLYNPTCKLVAIITHEPPRTEKGGMFY